MGKYGGGSLGVICEGYAGEPAFAETCCVLRPSRAVSLTALLRLLPHKGVAAAEICPSIRVTGFGTLTVPLLAASVKRFLTISEHRFTLRVRHRRQEAAP